MSFENNWAAEQLTRYLNDKQQVSEDGWITWKYTDETVIKRLQTTKKVVQSKAAIIVDLRAKIPDPNAPIDPVVLANPEGKSSDEVTQENNPYDAMAVPILREPGTEKISEKPFGEDEFEAFVKMLSWDYYRSQGENTLLYHDEIIKKLRKLSSLWREINADEVINFFVSCWVSISVDTSSEEMQKKKYLLRSILLWAINYVNTLPS